MTVSRGRLVLILPPELHSIQYERVVRVGLEAELAVVPVDMLENVQIPQNRLVGLKEAKRRLSNIKDLEER